MDGVAGITQPAIQPGETFKYEFIFQDAGTFMCHPHFDGMTQEGMGMTGMIVLSVCCIRMAQVGTKRISSQASTFEHCQLRLLQNPAASFLGGSPRRFALPGSPIIPAGRARRLAEPLMFCRSLNLFLLEPLTPGECLAHSADQST